MVKKMSFLSMIVSMTFLVFIFNACSNDLEFADESVSSEVVVPTTRTVPTHDVFGLYETEFIAAQHEVAGKISICNDYENVYVTFTTENGWQMRRTHLFIGPKEILHQVSLLITRAVNWRLW